MSARRKDKDSFNKKLVAKLLEIQGKTYEEWIEEKHKEFLDNEDAENQLLAGLDTLKEIGGI
ncbi:hypothetical protein ACSXC4_10435 [Clostridium perfringens]|uniref:Uncharacterized protein n=1 Tax=Clostridium perfringens TaxID=1502 RepID=A0A127EFR0_CLOPF|nr:MULTISPECIES: hypothetical protein [Clostridium]AMN34783.1 hypothetical protein JFP838_03120 [Clostridium perfringens]ELC8466031.1 hypothetical protein [Clostridium perfringens]MCX0355944.1 hypothetical protein [Clostridium perfringens]MDK7590445.1 hypothetical protein [Clostridium sp. UMB9555B]MDK7628508.1 hypothetical protein [Clostridium sp. UMB9555A]